VTAAAPARQGALLVVGTPIGNLGDASPRSLEALRSASVIYCEDTRVTTKLLTHFGIRVPLERADENVLARKVAAALERIAAGERVAFVSDAGMPGVSDPGQRLVDAALDAGLCVEVIPGPSAVICALVASGLPMEHFYFEGFLPRKQGAKRERIAAIARIPGALVIYESPHRVAATLQDIAAVLPGRTVALVRELTKVHEEVVRGLAPEVASRVAERENLKGECVVVVGPPTADEQAYQGGASPDAQAHALTLEEEIAAGLQAGERASALAKRLAKQFGVPRSTVYEQVVAARSEPE